MNTRCDPFHAVFDFQRALDTRLESGWLRGATAGAGAFPPINVFQQGDNLVAILELPGVKKDELCIFPAVRGLARDP
jgi:HSP20 family protein